MAVVDGSAVKAKLYLDGIMPQNHDIYSKSNSKYTTNTLDLDSYHEMSDKSKTKWKDPLTDS